MTNNELPHSPLGEAMSTPLPCDVTVGAITIKKGVALRVLVQRMHTLHSLACGNISRESRATMIRHGLDASQAMRASEHAANVEALERATRQLQAMRAEVETLRAELARATGQPLAAIHGTVAANADQAQVAA